MKSFKAPRRPARFLVLCCAFCLPSACVLRAQLPIPKAYPQPVAPPAPPKPKVVRPTRPPVEMVVIPGPLRSFLRMAGLSQKASAPEVMPLLARHIYENGYDQATPTEFMRLVERYVSQARELQSLAGPGNSIKVAECGDAGTLLRILGYRLRQGCGGKEISLETANPERAFLTTDSGFPITDLEEALQKKVPFVYPYAPSRLPVLFHESDWVALSAGQKVHFNNCLDILLNDPVIAHLYWAMSRGDVETANYLQRSLGLRRLLPVAAILDFYGPQISIRGGRVLVPGGAAAEPAWKALVGASPEVPVQFVPRLLARDDGWLAAYFDTLSRLDPAQQDRLTQPTRLARFYEAFHTGEAKGKAAASSFRQASSLLILDTRLSWEANGDPHVPGGLEVWRKILQQKTSVKMVRDWGTHVRPLEHPDQLIEAMTSSSRDQTENGPLQMYLTFCEMDRRRAPDKQLSAATVSLMADRFSTLGHWYLIFSEFPSLSDESIAQFINTSDEVEHLHGQALRANALGAFQANLGLWQILARQGEIPDAGLNASWTQAIEPFRKIASSAELFDVTSRSFQQILHATGAGPDSLPSEIIERLAGPVQQTPEGQRVHDKLVARMRAVLEDQQLVSLDTLFALSGGLEKMEQASGKGSDDLISLATELRGFELPRPIFTNNEKAAWAPAVYTSHHMELQVQTDLTKIIKTGGTRAQLDSARGQLTPFLRDTLVGLNYAYYEPPGAQILHINPLFVRAHDFLGVSMVGSQSIWEPPTLLGAGVSAGGGAYLMGSLVDLPFSLAEAEQDFIVPENVQALIWKELVPNLVTGATLPRWWNVTPNELHAIALYQRSGEELLMASIKDEKIRASVIAILAHHVSPQRLEELEDALGRSGGVGPLLLRMMPGDTFYLAEKFRAMAPEEQEAAGPAGKELAELARRSPDAANPDRLSADFGIPHPALARTNARELLNVPLFPLSGGYTIRVFGESLESSNLYWARLADEMGYPPVMLHLLVPELTRSMIGKIFASNIDDWPAVVRAMQETGDDLRQGKIVPLRKTAGISPVEQATKVSPNP